MGKKKWQTVNLDLNFNHSKAAAADSEASALNSEISNDVKSACESIRINLPKSTNATRSNDVLSSLPENGPFGIEISNVSYEADEEAIAHWFRDFNIKRITIYRHIKGRGLLEFDSIEDLEGAMGLNGQKFVGRPLSIKVLTVEEVEKQNQFSSRSRDNGGWKSRNPDNLIDIDADTNWRSNKQTVSKALDEETSTNWRSTKPVSSNVAEDSSNSDWRSNKLSISKVTDDSSSMNWRSNKPLTTDVTTTSNNWRSTTAADTSKVSAISLNSNGAEAWKRKTVHSEPVANQAESTNWRNSRTAVQPPTKTDECANWRQVVAPKSTEMSSKPVITTTERKMDGVPTEPQSNCWRRPTKQ